MELNRLTLLHDVSELGSLLTHSGDVESFLDQIVTLLSKHLRSDVCSIYLMDEEREELVLKATRGLRPNSVGQIRLKLTEGLVGWVMSTGESLLVKRASQHPRFKFFEDLDKDCFDAFLAVPIPGNVGRERNGVLVVQRQPEDPYDESDQLTLRAVAQHLAGFIGKARLFLTLRDTDSRPAAAQPGPEGALIHGKVACEGFAQAPALILARDHTHRFLSERHFPGTYTLAEFHAALAATEEQLNELQRRLEARLPEVASMIFTAHLLMLKDRSFVGAIEERIGRGEQAPVAVLEVAGGLIERFGKSKNPTFREKAKDVEDLTRRIIGNLVQRVYEPTSSCEGRIVIAAELLPSDILKLASENVAGVVMVSGGVTSHIAILARSLQVPMVLTDDPSLLQLRDGTQILLDADVGDLYLVPTATVAQGYRERQQHRATLSVERPTVSEQTHTADGQRVRLLANINLLSDVTLARELRAEGVGLYRTEFPFLIRNDWPTEDEQVAIYRQLCERLPERELTFRTLDLGGDKVLSYWRDQAVEANPCMGMRSIRFSLHREDLFLQQLRAILRAAATCPSLRLMFPMISSPDEFIQAREVVLTSLQQLRDEGLAHCQAPQIGMMVELPSLVEVMPEMAKLGDFFCVGTNDFTQFMLAVDRTNEKVAGLYLPHHPAVLRSLARIVRAVQAEGKDISICGEMAHEPKYIPFLLGIGIRTLSVDPRFLPKVQRQISRLTEPQVNHHAQALLKQGTVRAVSELLESVPGLG